VKQGITLRGTALSALKIKSAAALAAMISMFAGLYCCCPVGPAAAADWADAVAASCKPTAISTPDNDIRLDEDNRPRGQRVDVPAQVLGKLRAVGAEMLRHGDAPEPYPGQCNDLYPALFRISVPGGLYLYVAELSPNIATRLMVLILFNPATGALTKAPPKVDVKSTQMFGWKDPLLEKPLISFADLPGNHRQIVVEERVHNGTMYNGIVYNYFDVGADLSLTRVLALEKRVLAIGTDEGRMIVRKLQTAGPNQLRLESFMQAQDNPKDRRELGYVIVESPGPGAPFRVKQRHPKGKDNDSILVTYSMPEGSADDDSFLRNGYSFHY